MAREFPEKFVGPVKEAEGGVRPGEVVYWISGGRVEGPDRRIIRIEVEATRPGGFVGNSKQTSCRDWIYVEIYRGAPVV